ncbi:MAG: hypothetical protein GY769_20175 [bacterium]|nr:hypothetical protein [bacterium]
MKRCVKCDAPIEDPHCGPDEDERCEACADVDHTPTYNPPPGVELDAFGFPCTRCGARCGKNAQATNAEGVCLPCRRNPPGERWHGGPIPKGCELFVLPTDIDLSALAALVKKET